MLWSWGQTDIPELSSVLFSGLALNGDLEVFLILINHVLPHAAYTVPRQLILTKKDLNTIQTG